MKRSENVLVDTSVWIEYFNKPTSVMGQDIKKLIEEDRVATAGIIVAELLQGAKNEKEFEDLRESLFSLIFLQESYATWEDVGRLSFELRREGKMIPLSDCLIATLSKENHCLIYTLDAHFKRVKDLRFHK